MQYDSKENLEYLRYQAKQKFDKIQTTWIELGKWALPHRIKWLLSQTEGERVNQHIVDPTHIISLRNAVAGFSEGNTSSTRPWFRNGHADPELNKFQPVKEWTDTFTRRCLTTLSTSNFYHAVTGMYYDYNVFNTSAYYIEELQNGRLHFHVLEPGSYYVINNNLGVADCLVREFTLTVKALVEAYGRKLDNSVDWSNISSRVKKMYDDGTYTQKIDIVQVVKRNESFNPNEPIALMNKQWISCTYELGGRNVEYYQDGQKHGTSSIDVMDGKKFLRKAATRRKPFIVPRSDAGINFEYGEKGPMLDGLGLIKSLNKKAIGKDIALDQMLKPAVQGPASLRKSYITTAPNSFVPLDAQSAAAGGLKPILTINPAIATLNADVIDLREQVDKLFYGDYLLYLSKNPKTRTAAEVNAIIQEQQLVMGPVLQSLNFTHNEPVVDFIMDYVLYEDPYLPPAPEELQGETLRVEFISVFAQAQKAADLPAVNQYIEMVERVGQLNPKIWDKVNIDKLADIYEDRLFLPSGLNNPQEKVDAMREQAFRDQQRQQLLQETLPAIAGAAKDAGLVKQNG